MSLSTMFTYLLVSILDGLWNDLWNGLQLLLLQFNTEISAQGGAEASFT